jgi:RimJ/RimL family protein N-acetyltransferase
MSAATLETPSLRLVPYASEHLLALLDSVAEFEKRVGIPVADGMESFLNNPDVSPAWLERLRASPPGPDPWRHGFAVVHRTDGRIIGSIAFVAPLDERGEVEIAYGIVPGYQGRGYATEAAQAITDFAYADPRVRLVFAHTLPEVNASTHVLTKCGFRHVGDVEHPEDGTVWRWERSKG